MRKWFIVSLLLTVFFSCEQKNPYLEQALTLAGDNRAELEKVIAHYSVEKSDSLKLKAAIYLIENMPGHYSYKGDDILRYYEEADSFLTSALPLLVKKDSIEKIAAKYHYPDLCDQTIPDVEIITADYLIKNIDRSFELWHKPWVEHLTFDQFCEFILPYKCFDLQQLDDWKDTLSVKFTHDLYALPPNDENSESALQRFQTVFDELKRTVDFSVNTYNVYPFRNSSTIYKMPFGSNEDYANLLVSTLRSMGIPVFSENMPQWGDTPWGHNWYSILDDHGKIMSSSWGIFSGPGFTFFPTERIPKVFRRGYAINRQTEEYLKKASYKHPAFHIFNQDVTDEYVQTSDLSIPVSDKKIKDGYAYIAVFNWADWNIIDYGIYNKERAEFKKMGRNMLYIVLGYDGNGVVPVSHPFILDRGGKITYLAADTLKTRKVVLTRTHARNYYMADLQFRLFNGKIQASDTKDFVDPVTLYTLDNLHYPPNYIELKPDKPYRYWRYLFSDNSYGNIAELQFFQNDTVKVTGRILSSSEGVSGCEKEKAFDGNWLTFFETQASDGSWIGLDLGKPVAINKVRCVPRMDDHYICRGNTYELKYWNAATWHSLGTTVAEDDYVVYDRVPENALLRLSNLTHENGERIFTYKDNKQVWW